MKSLTFIKLGGSLITDKTQPFKARHKVIRNLAKEISSFRGKLIIGHGGGSFPHVPAKKYKTHLGNKNKNWKIGLVKTQDAAARLNRIVVKALLDAGVNVFSVQPSSSLIAENGKIKYWNIKPVKELLNKGFVPVVYGDAVVDLKKGSAIISTEMLFEYLAKSFKANKMISCGITAVYKDYPKNKELIKEITKENFKKVEKFLCGSGGIDVTGGMFHKVHALYKLSKLGIECQIINGLKNGNLRAALKGKKIGTIIKY